MEGDPDARLDLSDYTIPDESRGETMSDVECWRADAKWWKKEDDKHLREIKRLRIALHEIAQSDANVVQLQAVARKALAEVK